MKTSQGTYEWFHIKPVAHQLQVIPVYEIGPNGEHVYVINNCIAFKQLEHLKGFMSKWQDGTVIETIDPTILLTREHLTRVKFEINELKQFGKQIGLYFKTRAK